MTKRITVFFLAVTAVFMLLSASAQPARASDYIAANDTASNGCPYYIMVNRAMNTVTVYGLDEEGYYTVPVKAMVCSVGRAGHSTPLGTFSLTGYKREWNHMLDGTYGQYATQFYGNYLFHSICYSEADPSALLMDEYNKLGEPASLGCVRLQTVDAKWIYDNCAAGTMVTIYDGESPGPLGKPSTFLEEILPEQDNGWDPTDPRPENPWRERLITGVSIDKSILTVAEGQRKRLTAEVTPSTATIPEKITWSSNNTAVAWVDEDGGVSGMSRGTAVITATCGNFTGVCTVRVSGSLDVDVSICEDAVPLEAGEKQQFTAARVAAGSAVPGQVRWSSSDKTVARVEPDGTVIAVGEGTATVTARCGNGSDSREIRVSGSLLSFEDVEPGVWYYTSVRRASENGVLSGASETEFVPEMPVTYGLALRTLYQLSGGEAEAEQSEVLDWAVQSGLAGEGLEPDALMTRQNLAVMLRRMSGRPTVLTPSAMDERLAHRIARSAVIQAEKGGLLEEPVHVLRPASSVNRAQFAVAMHNFGLLNESEKALPIGEGLWFDYQILWKRR